MEPRQQQTLDGQELQQGDLDNAFDEAARADDHVLSECLRLAPYTGAVARAIVPYGVNANTLSTLMPTGNADGKVNILPFRAIIGSRTAVDATVQNQLKSWRDINSKVYVASTDNVTLGYKQSLAANASGNPRWDLVYVVVTPDANAVAVNRYVKPATPVNAAPAVQSVVTQLNTTLAIGVVTGTPGASPAFPAIPTDVGGNYYIALGYVRVANGFGAASTVDQRDIYESLPAAQISRVAGTQNLAPANQSNAVAGSMLSSANFGFTGASLQKPATFLPPSMVGGESLFFELDLGGLSAANSHPSGAVATNIIDNSRDWRKRLFLTFFQGCATGGNAFANDRASGASAAARIPSGGVGINNSYTVMGQSFTADASAVAPHAVGAGSSIVAHVTQATLASMRGAGALLVIYVDGTDGSLRLDYDTTGPQAKFMVWTMATSPMADY